MRQIDKEIFLKIEKNVLHFNVLTDNIFQEVGRTAFGIPDQLNFLNSSKK
jgi:hypothetical protein